MYKVHTKHLYYTLLTNTTIKEKNVGNWHYMWSPVQRGKVEGGGFGGYFFDRLFQCWLMNLNKDVWCGCVRNVVFWLLTSVWFSSGEPFLIPGMSPMQYSLIVQLTLFYCVLVTYWNFVLLLCFGVKSCSCLFTISNYHSHEWSLLLVTFRIRSW